MPTRILVVGDPSRTRLPAVPPSLAEGATVEWFPPADRIELANISVLILDLTSAPADAVGDLLAQTAAVPRIAVTDGPAAPPGVEVIDLASHPDPFAEVAARLDRLQVTAKVRWLHGLGGDPFVRQVLDMVLVEGAKSVANIAAAVAAGDAAAAGRVAHQFKSAVGNVGAQATARAAGRVEAAAAGGDVEGLRASAEELAGAWTRAVPVLEASRAAHGEG